MPAGNFDTTLTQAVKELSTLIGAGFMAFLTPGERNLDAKGIAYPHQEKPFGTVDCRLHT